MDESNCIPSVRRSARHYKEKPEGFYQEDMAENERKQAQIVDQGKRSSGNDLGEGGADSSVDTSSVWQTSQKSYQPEAEIISLASPLSESVKEEKREQEPLTKMSNYKCITCRQRISSVPEMKEHARMHMRMFSIKAAKTFSCKECGECFSTKSNLDKHVFLHATKRELQQEDKGHSQMASSSGLQQHEKRESSETHGQLEGREPQGNASLETLQKTQNTTPKNKRFKCGECDKTFAYNYEVLNHQRGHLKPSSYTCYRCGKCYKIAKYYQQHVFSDSCGNTSDVHNETFSDQKHLNHRNRHSVEGYCSCKECGILFTSEAHLRKHVITHTKDQVNDAEIDIKPTLEDSKPFKCNKCGDSFVSGKAVRTHRLRYCSRYSCGFCKEAFTVRYLYDRHLRQHTQGKPYQCQDCGRMFQLVKSQRKHKMAKPGGIICRVCGEVSYSVCEWALHKKGHENNGQSRS